MVKIKNSIYFFFLKKKVIIHSAAERKPDVVEKNQELAYEVSYNLLGQ